MGRLSCKFSPSDTVRDVSNTKAFLNDGKVVRNQVPVALFSVALAKLQQRLEKNDALVSQHEVTLASTYITQAQARKFHDDEWGLVNAIKKTINSALRSKGHLNETLEWAGDIKPDGCWLVDGFTSIILELKDVPGTGGDPILQSIADLCNIIASTKVLCLRPFDRRLLISFSMMIIGDAVTFRWS